MAEIASQSYRIRMFHVATMALVAVASAYYLFLLTNGRFDFFVEESYGFVFNDMALRLLHWDFTVDPFVIKEEAFYANGRTYTYFGIFPALLRIPFAPFIPLEKVALSRLSVWAALSVAAWAQASLLRHAWQRFSAGRSGDVAYYATLVALLFTGPQLGLTYAAHVHVEPIVWGTAQLLLFVRLAGIRLIDAEEPSPPDWLMLGLLAGLGFCTRPPEGLAMVIGGAFLVFVPFAAETTQAEARGARVPLLVVVMRQMLSRRPWLLLLGAAPFLLVAMLVNWERWGDPLTFARPEFYDLMKISPRRSDVYARLGTFNVIRIPTGILYYFFGFPGFGQIVNFLDRYYDDVNWLRSLFFATNTEMLALSTVGLWMSVRRSRGSSERRLAALLAGPVVPALLLVMAPYLTFRYRYEFVPLFSTGCVLGLAYLPRLQARTVSRISVVLVLLTACNIPISHFDLLHAKLYGSANAPPLRDWIIDRTAPVSSWIIKK